MIDYYRIVGPVLTLLPAEFAQRLTLAILRARLLPPEKKVAGPELETTLAGLKFANPLGIAAGFDKDAVTGDVLFRLGVSTVEFGTVTPLPQLPNEGTRLVRLRADEAAINRFGFPSDGLEAVSDRLADAFPQPTRANQRIGVNIGPNRNSQDWLSDYETGLRRLSPLADYVVVNVSSPNTPELRRLQHGSQFSRLAERLANARASLNERPRPLFFKIAPDLTLAELQHVIRETKSYGLDGLVIGNTTIQRPLLKSADRDAQGGLSGRPIFSLTTEMLSRAYQESGGELTLVGVGGIFSAVDLYEKIRAGASLCQIYTCLYYRGPHTIPTLLSGLQKLVVRDGFSNVAEAVGSLHSSTRRLSRESPAAEIDAARTIAIGPSPIVA